MQAKEDLDPYTHRYSLTHLRLDPVLRLVINKQEYPLKIHIGCIDDPLPKYYFALLEQVLINLALKWTDLLILISNEFYFLSISWL